MDSVYMYKQRNIPIRFFYNISSKTLLNRMFLKSLDYIFKEKKGFAESTIFELALNDLTENLAALKPSLRKIKAYGASLSVDNIRHLNVNLLELQDLHFDFIKIDAEAFLNSSESAVIDFLSSCKMKCIEVICCKIETIETLKAISAYNIKYAQGFLFDKPKPLKKAT
jgi:EAL domain-containing protein (putative c-di-GMP-specific phosphodiesterase class I)